SARQHYASVSLQLKISNPKYASLARVQPLKVKVIQRDLPADATLVSYFLSSSQLHAWVLDRETLSYVPLPISDTSLEHIGCWLNELMHHPADRGMQPLGRICSGALDGAEVGYDILIAPLRAKVRHPHLIIVPHAFLHFVPFAALRDRTTGRY